MNTLRPTAANESGIQAAHRERPIIMSGDNPKLILEGRKTQTRRIIQPGQPDGETVMHFNYGKAESLSCPYGRDGDRLWVRETFTRVHPGMLQSLDPDPDSPHWQTLCRSSDSLGDYKERVKWKPSIHMPRWASRITLEITKVRVERLQDISEEDAKAEGVTPRRPDQTPRNIDGNEGFVESYALLWDSLHGKGAWDKNPWVWVIEFCLSPKESSTATLTTKEKKKEVLS